MLRSLLISFALLTSAPLFAANCDADLAWHGQIDFAKIENTLLHGKIVQTKDLRQQLEAEGKTRAGTMDSKLLIFEDGIKGVYKKDDWGSAAAEAGAYRAVYKLLGQKIIPPTVERDGGSVQYFVEHPHDLLKDESPLSKVPEQDIFDRDMFYFVFGQWDRNRGNQLVDASHRLAVIDNAMINTRMQLRWGEMPFVQRLWLKEELREKNPQKPFPFHKAKLVVNPTDDMIVKEWSPYVPVGDIRGHIAWWPKYANRTIEYVIWGECIWVRHIGFWNFPAIKPERFSRETLKAYARLTYENLRATLPPRFTDEYINEILERRDQLLKAGEQGPFFD